MDIQFAILGLLSWQSLSGYDIKKIIAESEVFYWSGNNNQIYNSLIALHKQGLVTQEVIQQESLPAKKIYTLTKSGRQKLQEWLLSPPELPDLHNHFLIQLIWADLLSTGELDDLLARYEEEINVQLRMRQVQASQPPAAPSRTPRERYLWRSIVENIVNVYQNELNWVRQLRKDLREVNFADTK
jgi:DNA-binding PadR family transcriptional regulator